MQSELTGEIPKELEKSERKKYFEETNKLIKSLEQLENDVTEIKKTHNSRMEDVKKQYNEVLSKLKKITNRLMKSQDKDFR